ncbi:MAG: PilT/PilU family type 4a pilus ATPase [Pyramidobacter sp.]|nr:PilT/PilU family type 4a pilus ATPase [Pyramidobacter sp.]
MPGSDLWALFDEAVECGASDVHLSCGRAPLFRIDGRLEDSGRDVVGREWLLASIRRMLSAAEWNDWELNKSISAAHEFGVPAAPRRFRLSCFWSRGQPAAAVRLIAARIPTPEQCGLPAVLKELCAKGRGLLLFTGPSGSGKSTALASLVDWLNGTCHIHIVTLEDPVEFVHDCKRALLHQRQIGRDCPSFAAGLRDALRQDPDVIEIGEMRDGETISAAITGAETGHLVLATLHAPDAPQAVERIIDVFPAAQQAQIRAQTALSLAGVCAMRLVPQRAGGRCLATEMLVGTAAVRSAIRESRTAQLKTILQTSQRDGMHTMEQSLLRLVEQKRIAPEAALAGAFDGEEMKRLLGGRLMLP